MTPWRRWVACGWALLWAAAWLAGLGASPPSGQASPAPLFVTADATTERVLDRAREALGGRERLLGVKTLLIEGARTLAGGPASRFTYRLLLPECFQETSVVTCTIRGSEFWQRPPARASAVAFLAAAKKRLFAEQSLVLLLRAPSVLPVTAALVTADWGGTARRAVRFTGADDFDLTLVFGDPDGAPIGYLVPGSYGAPTGQVSQVTRRLVFTAFKHVHGLRFPVTIDDAIADARAEVEFFRVEVNAGVRPEDFEKRP